MTKEIILADFDGTVILSDIAEQILRKFASDKWLYYDQLFLSGKLPLEETLIKQYSLLKASKEDILEYTRQITKLRSNFKSFADVCFNKNLELIIVSGGIDFTIKYILDSLNLPKELEIISVRTQYNSDGSLSVKRPIRFNNEIKDFKLDLVQHYKELGYFVYYLGDGASDRQGVKSADKIYSVKNSSLSKYLEEIGLPFVEFEDFQELIDVFQKT